MAAAAGAPQPPPPPGGGLPSGPPAPTDDGLNGLQNCSTCKRDKPRRDFQSGVRSLKICAHCRAYNIATEASMRKNATDAPAPTGDG
ncbi:hypothetical protein LTR09_003711 [Extremus antarcticus]|uniref:Uncharacterized protein n=1 Tax=Extremus antarcticus TaxID=702011 RepID=A0AAJ0DQU1_9PEZI|nr:hypothetical protein LTR09_003711 [Extremus antarcticus]